MQLLLKNKLPPDTAKRMEQKPCWTLGNFEVTWTSGSRFVLRYLFLFCFCLHMRFVNLSPSWWSLEFNLHIWLFIASCFFWILLVDLFLQVHIAGSRYLRSQFFTILSIFRNKATFCNKSQFFKTSQFLLRFQYLQNAWQHQIFHRKET